MHRLVKGREHRVLYAWRVPSSLGNSLHTQLSVHFHLKIFKIYCLPTSFTGGIQDLSRWSTPLSNRTILFQLRRLLCLPAMPPKRKQPKAAPKGEVIDLTGDDDIPQATPESRAKKAKKETKKSTKESK